MLFINVYRTTFELSKQKATVKCENLNFHDLKPTNKYVLWQQLEVNIKNMKMIFKQCTKVEQAMGCLCEK